MKRIGMMVTLLGLLGLPGLPCKAQPAASLVSIEKGFQQLPDSIRIGCYWYWLSDNISREGVIKDLHAMKKAGITRAYIGNIGLNDIPYGKVKVFTPEWWNILHVALKTATELDIEIGIFNSPGWSQSGGPWVKSDQSMRYLAATDTQFAGGKKIAFKFPGFSDTTQLVKVLAYPVDKNVYSITKAFSLNGREPVDVRIPADSTKTIRSLVFRTKDYIRTNAWIQVWENNAFKTIRTIEIDRSNYQNIVGFDPYAPVVISLPETKGKEYRIWLDTPVDYYSKNPEISVALSSEPVVERYPEQTLAKMFQRPLPFWNTYMWNQQDWYNKSGGFKIRPDQVLDLTKFVSDKGVLTWEAPKGAWTVSLLEMKTTGTVNSPATPDATGLEVDKMSSKHVAAHFDAFLGEILRRIPAVDRKTFKIAVQDSYETGGQNWTDDMPAVFKKTYGYDPTPYLPAMYGKVVGNEDVSARFLWDLRRLIADRVAYDYVGGLTKISHRHGLTTWLENYGHWGFPSEFLMYGGQADEVGGEFWSSGELGDIENRDASSAAHIYGKTRVWAESNTSGGPNFGLYPSLMKPRIDRFFAEGINASLLHVYIHQPYEDKNPGISAWFGNDFQRKNTWFPQMDVFTGYLRRSNLLLQQGTYVADVAYFIGEDAPKMRGITNPALPKGYSFDYINAEVLMNRASVKDGYLVLEGGMRYRMLVLPDQKSMRPELLKKISGLVKAGLSVYGSAPEYSPSLQNYPAADDEVKNLGKALFAGKIYGRGKVFNRGTSLQKALYETGVEPDFKTLQDSVAFIHRTLNDGEIYYLTNQTDKKIFFQASFRVPEGLQPELWNPLTGERRSLPQFRAAGKGIEIPVELENYESVFIVFRKSNAPVVNKPNFPDKEVVYTINTPWQVAFQDAKDRRAVKNPVTLQKLEDWTRFKNDSIKYFSGEAVYTTTFTINNLPQKKLYLDLGKVMVMATIRLNGQYIGGVWTTPYRLNITPYLKSGANTLEVTVANNWQNRLIGDLRLPEEERQTWTIVNHFKADTPLQPSGLLGPVEIRAYDY
ncbi:glycoside hydrolase family 2 [Niabella ginsenosidivorans]|uniref:Glycoside hydrolase family 2 n=1 Tax=Niabella ginsenosidivorans TaxID=1176587 RepID=A0A1A9IB77_9BACT|nr:glycoside hydrolase family 2 [Niabella ginsenosidivorans]